MAKVIHVHLLHNIGGTKQKDWYFSSISAVYTVLTAEQVGATKNYLLHAGLSGNGTICTKRCYIESYNVCDFYIAKLFYKGYKPFISLFILHRLHRLSFY